MSHTRVFISAYFGVLVTALLLAGCSGGRQPKPAHHRQTVRVIAPATSAHANVIMHVAGLPLNSPVVAVGGVIPVFGITASNGSLDLDVPLWPGTENRLVVQAVIGGQVRSVAVLIRQSAPTGVGILTGHVVTTDGRPVLNALVRYGKSVTRSGAAGAFRLTGLPTGQVTATVTAAGYSPGVASASITDNSLGVAVGTRLEALPPKKTVGSRGAVFRGSGWKVTVPPGALPSPQVLRVGPLSYSGLIDAAGQPVVQIMPANLRFAKPVSVTLDPRILGARFTAKDITALDPTTLRSERVRIPGTRGNAYHITVTRGTQIRIRPPPARLNNPLQCRAFNATDNPRNELNTLRVALSSFMSGTGNSAAWSLYDIYLTPGRESLTRFEVGDPTALAQFAQAPETLIALLHLAEKTVAKLGAKHPVLLPPDSPVAGALAELGIGTALKITWANYLTTPGLIAGSTGRVELNSGADFPDERNITGWWELLPHADSRGVLTNVTLRLYKLRLNVNDSIDFCPGALGWWPAPAVTLPMSRLERTPFPGGGTYTKPVLFHVSAPLKDQYIDVTYLYPTNDPDHDGCPDTQPWQGASYLLDSADQPGSNGGACHQTARFPSSFTAKATGTFNQNKYTAVLEGQRASGSCINNSGPLPECSTKYNVNMQSGTMLVGPTGQCSAPFIVKLVHSQIILSLTRSVKGSHYLPTGFFRLDFGAILKGNEPACSAFIPAVTPTAFGNIRAGQRTTTMKLTGGGVTGESGSITFTWKY